MQLNPEIISDYPLADELSIRLLYCKESVNEEQVQRIFTLLDERVLGWNNVVFYYRQYFKDMDIKYFVLKDESEIESLVENILENTRMMTYIFYFDEERDAVHEIFTNEHQGFEVFLKEHDFKIGFISNHYSLSTEQDIEERGMEDLKLDWLKLKEEKQTGGSRLIISRKIK